MNNKKIIKLVQNRLHELVYFGCLNDKPSIRAEIKIFAELLDKVLEDE